LTYQPLVSGLVLTKAKSMNKFAFSSSATRKKAFSFWPNRPLTLQSSSSSSSLGRFHSLSQPFLATYRWHQTTRRYKPFRIISISYKHAHQARNTFNVREWRYYGTQGTKPDHKEKSIHAKDDTNSSYNTTTSSSYNNNNSNIKINSSETSDPAVLGWVDTHLPESFKPYARLARIDKPIGTWLLLWPCYWSTALASASQQAYIPDPYLLGLFGVGAVVMRGAGCTINDLWDRDIDQQVARTKTRPLAGGDVTVPQAIAFLAAQLSIGLGVLVSLPHMEYCFLWGAASLPLVALYPLTKRFFTWPQLFLGITMNWGAWMGWAATYGSMDYSVLPFLYGSGVTWTLVYDTIYAHQDKHDDAKLGLCSTALAFGKDDDEQKKVLHGFAALTWLQWMAVGYNASDFLAFPYYQLGVTTAYAHLVWQIQTADFNDPHSVMARFRSNSTLGAIIFGAITVGGALQ